MSKEKHTPEPWAVNKYGSIGGGPTGTLPIVATVEPFYGVDTKYGCHRANAARIVACVNACKGIPTEALEAGVITEMVELMREAIDFIVDFHNDGARGFVAPEAHNVFEKLCDTLALLAEAADNEE